MYVGEHSAIMLKRMPASFFVYPVIPQIYPIEAGETFQVVDEKTTSFEALWDQSTSACEDNLTIVLCQFFWNANTHVKSYI
jgi:RNAse (barnase) inhibitor barstar